MSRDLSPREARDRFIARRKQENTEQTVRSYRNRLTRFVQWAEEQGLESMAEVSGWDLDEYRAAREAEDISPATLRGQMMALKQLLDYCESIDVVDGDLPEKVNIPTLTRASARPRGARTLSEPVRSPGSCFADSTSRRSRNG